MTVLRFLEPLLKIPGSATDHQALSTPTLRLGRYSLRPSGSHNPIETLDSAYNYDYNYYVECMCSGECAEHARDTTCSSVYMTEHAAGIPLYIP